MSYNIYCICSVHVVVVYVCMCVHIRSISAHVCHHVTCTLSIKANVCHHGTDTLNNNAPTHFAEATATTNNNALVTY